MSNTTGTKRRGEQSDEEPASKRAKPTPADPNPAPRTFDFHFVVTPGEEAGPALPFLVPDLLNVPATKEGLDAYEMHYMRQCNAYGETISTKERPYDPVEKYAYGLDERFDLVGVGVPSDGGNVVAVGGDNGPPSTSLFQEDAAADFLPPLARDQPPPKAGHSTFQFMLANKMPEGYSLPHAVPRLINVPSTKAGADEYAQHVMKYYNVCGRAYADEDAYDFDPVTTPAMVDDGIECAVLCLRTTSDGAVAAVPSHRAMYDLLCGESL